MKINLKPILIALIFIASIYTLSRVLNFGVPTNELFYSEFLKEVEKGNINEVSIRGDKIEGAFLNGDKFFVYTAFDETIIAKLLESNSTIDVTEYKTVPWYLGILLNWGPLLFLIGIWILMMKNSSSGVNMIFSVGKSNPQKTGDNEKPKVNFSDVAGVEEVKEEVTEIVEFLNSTKQYSDVGGKIPKGILLVGAPGTGKTLLARAIAGESGVPFFSIAGSEFVEMFVGVGASRVRDLFRKAKMSAPCVIFIDEIDAVGRQRGTGLGGGHDEKEQTLNQLLNELDGFAPNKGIIVIAATNRVDILDKALLRPGRFDRHVYIPLPDIDSREAILKVHAKKIKMASKSNLKDLAKITQGFSGSELANLLNEAALKAVKEKKKEVGEKHLNYARDKITIGLLRKSVTMTKEAKKSIAYHEAGHALVSHLLKKTDPIHKITIIPAGNSLGVTTHLPKKDYYNYSRERLEDHITVAMGGKASEEIFLKAMSSGVEGDLKQATSMAYNMVCKWGMSKEMGPISVDIGGGGGFMDYYKSDIISDDLRNKIDLNVLNLLKNCYQKAKTLLQKNKKKLEAIVKELLKKEMLTGEELLVIIKSN
jgi:cell division protease FtsH